MSGLGRDRAREVAEAAILEVADDLGWPERGQTKRRIADAWDLGLAHPRRPE